MPQFTAFLVLAATLALPAPDNAPLENMATKAIDTISMITARNNGFSADQETDLYIKLSETAHHDRKFENALVFAECGNELLKKDKGQGTFLDMMMWSADGKDWNKLQAMGQRYSGDGVLSGVNYKAITAPNGRDMLFKAAFPNDQAGYEAREQLLAEYLRKRALGIRPDEAFGALKARDDGATSRGMQAMEDNLYNLGRLALTGYGRERARHDVADLLEARYAYYAKYGSDHLQTRDIAGVKETDVTVEFIGRKVEDAMHADLRRVMQPVNSLVNNFVRQKTPKPPVAPPDGAPNFNDLNRVPQRTVQSTGGMPSWDQMQRPPSVNNFELGPGWETETWWTLKESRHKGFELKLQRIAYGVDVFKMRQSYGDQGIHAIDSWMKFLKPNTRYVARFNVWYWADPSTSAYFADGSYAAEPPKPARAYLQPGGGKNVAVTVHFTTDAEGHGRLALFVRGRCAAELAEFYYAHVADARK